VKRKWEVQRTTVERLDGQRRWDIAYQRLLQWASEVEEVPAGGISDITTQEEQNESCHLRPCFNLTPTTEPNH
jgi:hypothetical protein